MNEKFFVDDIVVDSALAAAMRSFGGDTLTRITFANPCTDTISITRYGDTLLCEDYLWMKLHLDNDTSVTAASIQLSYLHQNALIIAQPNFLYEPASDMTPDDELYVEQISLKDRIGIERAWETTTGRYDVIVGVIDDGIDYHHCDLGGVKGEGHKVSFGIRYFDNSDSIHIESLHGTGVSGIIGALTNQSQPECGELRGIAGIAGGWADSIGCQLMGYKVNTLPDSGFSKYPTDYLIAAIREASADAPWGHYGNANHILNMSLRSIDTMPDFSVRSAVNYAFEHGASFVQSRGNSKNHTSYPGSAFSQKSIVVGGAKSDKILYWDHPYGMMMDIIAPAADWDCKSIAMVNVSTWNAFGGSSGAAAHVSGVLALLRSYAFDQSEQIQLYPGDGKVWKYLEPEDYEGILLASALDRTEAQDTNYRIGYDEHTGWGHLQADKIFELLEDSNYVVLHFEVGCFYTPCETDTSDWTEPYSVYFLHNTPYFFHPYFSNGMHTVRRSARRVTINLDSLNNIDSVKAKRIVTDANTPMYAWGRKGRNGLGGFSAENLPNFQTRWTKVTSSTGIPEGENTVPGIIHTNNKNIELLTYQYQPLHFETGEPIGPPMPHDDEIVFNFSIFCKYDELVGVNEQVALCENPDINIYPNPASNQLNIEINNKNQYLSEIEITDIYGQRLLHQDSNSGNLSNRTNIDITGLNSGTYFCKLRIGKSIVTKSFTVIK